MNYYRLYQGNCLDAFPLLEDKSIDLIFTDPPYNEKYKYRGVNFTDYREDYYEFVDSVLSECKRVLRDEGSIYFKHSSRQIDKILPIFVRHFKLRNLIIWISNSMAHPKNNYDSYYEPIYFGTKTDNYYFKKRGELRKRPKDYWSGEGKKFVGLLTNCWYDIPKVQAGCLRKVEGGTVGHEKRHPCSMPYRLAERAIRVSCPDNGVVLDPFIGSGSTMYAAQENARSCIGIELFQHYCDIVKERCFNRRFLNREVKYEFIVI